MARYAIWDKVSDVYVPTGARYTAEQWMEKRPVAKLESVKVVCAGGEINGAFFGVLGDMVNQFERSGCNFSACITDQDYLDVIEDYENAMSEPSAEPTAEERQAAALEAIAEGATSESTEAMNALLGV